MHQWFWKVVAVLALGLAAYHTCIMRRDNDPRLKVALQKDHDWEGAVFEIAFGKSRMATVVLRDGSPGLYGRLREHDGEKIMLEQEHLGQKTRVLIPMSSVLLIRSAETY